MFVDPTTEEWVPFPDQVHALLTIPRISADSIEGILMSRGISQPAPKRKAPQPEFIGPAPEVSLESLRIPRATKQLIVSGWVAGGAYPTRSELDAAVVLALVNAGHTDNGIRAVFANAAWRIGQKYREPGEADHHLGRTIAHARRRASGNGTGKGHAETQAAQASTLDQQPKARIDADDHDLPRVTGAAWEAVLAANDPPTLFRYGSAPARVEHDDEGKLAVTPLAVDRLRHHLGQPIDWYVLRKRGKATVDLPALPPMHVVRDMLARPDPPLPVLTRIVYAPVFAADGTLPRTPGYHAGTRVFLAPDPTLQIPDVPVRPNQDQVKKAKTLLIEDLLVDFPFVSDAERANAIALFLLPFVRELIPGPTPLHLFEKPTAGTGATPLVDMLQRVFTGRDLESMTEGRDEDEWRKRVTAKLLTGTSYIVIDNIQRRFDSAAVSSAITATTWEDRRLGGNEMVRIAIRCARVATSNNPVLLMEIARRTIRIRLDARMEEPWLRDSFKHDGLKGWVTEHRGELIWAALVLARAWLSERRLCLKPRLGMFESWSGVIGGILEVVGIPKLLGNLEDFYATTDTDTAAWRGLVEAWWERWRDREVGVADLWSLVEPPAFASDGTRLETEPINLNLGDGTDKSRRTKFGVRLVEVRDRQFGPYRIVAGGKRKGAQLWKLEVVG